MRNVMKGCKETQNDENHLKTKKEVARFLGVSLGSIERLMRGGLPYVRVGGLVRFIPEDMAGYIERRRVKTEAA